MKQDILKRIQVLSKKIVLTKKIGPASLWSKARTVGFSIDIHHDDSTVCNPKCGFRSNCPPWSKVEFIQVQLIFEDETEENTIFPLLLEF